MNVRYCLSWHEIKFERSEAKQPEIVGVEPLRNTHNQHKKNRIKSGFINFNHAWAPSSFHLHLECSIFPEDARLKNASLSSPS